MRRRRRSWEAEHTVTGDRFVLRPLRAADRKAFFAGIDDEVRARMGWTEVEVASHAALFQLLRWLPEQPPFPPTHLAVELDGTYAGAYSVHPYVRPADEIEVGWHLDARARGRELGTATLRGYLDYVHRTHGVASVRMGTSVDNVAALRQIEAAGAVAYEERDHVLPNGSSIRGRWHRHLALVCEPAGADAALPGSRSSTNDPRGRWVRSPDGSDLHRDGHR